MMKQEEIVQETKNAAVSEETKDEEKKKDIYGAIFFFVAGLAFSFAPEYIQTNIGWIVNTSAILCFSCWGASFYYIHEAYPNLLRNLDSLLNIAIVISSISAITFYFLSKTGGKPFSYPNFQVELRIMSFLGFLITVLVLVLRLPDFIDFCAHHKGKVRAFFTAKHAAGLVLGTLAIGTALFQFIQVVLQIFHL